MEKLKNGSDYFPNDLVCLLFALFPVWITQQGWLNMQLKRNTATRGGVYTVCISLQMWKFEPGTKHRPQVVTDNENIVFIFHFVWLTVVLMFIFFSLTFARHTNSRANEWAWKNLWIFSRLANELNEYPWKNITCLARRYIINVAKKKAQSVAFLRNLSKKLFHCKYWNRLFRVEMSSSVFRRGRTLLLSVLP